MNVLITGGSGLLGKYLTETRPPNVNIKSTWYANFVGADYQMDVCNKSQVSYVFNLVKPELVIHCAANGSVDYAEKNYTDVRMVNIEGIKNVATVAKDYGAKFIFISTNAVFGGDNPPYNEKSERRPVNRYGSIKREAEDWLMGQNNWQIIRPFLLYGWNNRNARPNWFTTVLKNLTDGKETRLVNDVYWQPTSAKDCARAVWKLAEYKNEIFHVATDERVTLYEFGLAVAKIWGYDGARYIQPIASSDLKGIAPRPVDTTYDLSKLHEAGIELAGVEKGLRDLL